MKRGKSGLFSKDGCIATINYITNTVDKDIHRQESCSNDGDSNSFLLCLLICMLIFGAQLY